MRRLVIVGQRARPTADFLLDDLPGTSGRLDVLLRCLRAGLMVSHGLRRDTVVYLVLLGGAEPRTLRYSGSEARFLRPDERSAATLARKVLAVPAAGGGFSTVRPGIAVAAGGIETVRPEVTPGAVFVLDEAGDDVRGADLPPGDVTFFVGDHTGFTPEVRGFLASLGARPLRVGPVSVHADDAVALLHNELDRRAR